MVGLVRTHDEFVAPLGAEKAEQAEGNSERDEARLYECVYHVDVVAHHGKQRQHRRTRAHDMELHRKPTTSSHRSQMGLRFRKTRGAE